MHSETSPGVAPLLFRNAVPRTAGPEIPGAYHPGLGVWAVEGPSGPIPIVEADDSYLLEITTKTKVREESDDDNELAGSARARGAILTEIVTKTAIQLESDDELNDPGRLSRGADRIAIAELVTKTDVQQESDDQIQAAGIEGLRRGRRLLELETKTHAEVEQDDHTPIL